MTFVYHIFLYSFGYILYHFIPILIGMYFYCYVMCSFDSLSIFIVMYVSFCVLFVCKCVLYCCNRGSAQLQLKINYKNYAMVCLCLCAVCITYFKSMHLLDC
jgi:hypothetical protein